MYMVDDDLYRHAKQRFAKVKESLSVPEYHRGMATQW